MHAHALPGLFPPGFQGDATAPPHYQRAGAGESAQADDVTPRRIWFVESSLTDCVVMALKPGKEPRESRAGGRRPPPPEGQAGDPPRGAGRGPVREGRRGPTEGQAGGGRVRAAG